MNQKTRISVYNKFDGRCSYCGKDIEYKDMQVDHQISKHNGGTDDFNNLYPSCRRCNHYKRAKNLKGFRVYMKKLHERLRNDYIVKIAEDYGIIKIKPFDGEFYFERHKGGEN